MKIWPDWANRGAPNRVPGVAIATVLLILLATIGAYRLVVSSQNAHIATVVDTYSRVFTARLEERLQARILIVQLIKEELSLARSFETDRFVVAAGTANRQLADVQALNWVNPDGIIEIVTPRGGNEAALGLNVRSLDIPSKALEQAVRRRQLRVTPPISLAQGGQGFVAYDPVFRDGVLFGFINLVFRAEPLVASAMGANAARRFRISVYDGSQPLLEQDVPLKSRRFSATRRIVVGGRIWDVVVSPTPAEIAHTDTILDESILVFGCLLAIAAGFLLTEYSSSKTLLRDREERFALAMKGASDGIFDWNTATGTTYFSPRWFELLGYEDGELPSTFETFASLVHPDDVEQVVETPAELELRKVDYVENEFRMRHKNGSWRTILSRAHTVRKGGKVVRVVGTHVDITERIERQKALEIAATTDDLTGLKNRRGLRTSLSDLSQSLGRGEILAIFHLDLDKFKAINDTNGHDAGDAALVVTAGRLQQISDGFDLIARIGGDEFLLAKKVFGARGQISPIAERLIEAINEPFTLKGQRIRVGASVGISFSGALRYEEVDQAISDADIALHHAKSQGRGQHVFFDTQMRDVAIQIAQKTSQIENGLENGEFQAYFQPQVALQSGVVTGFETLARWIHPTRGVLTAAEFIPFAETANLAESIDGHMFRQACRALRNMNDAGQTEISVSVNLSTARLNDPKLVHRLVEIAAAEGASVQNIRIEILENTLLTDGNGTLSRNLFRLAEVGFPLELDDFGSGHAAIASLRTYPISRIKIDRSLITNVAADKQLQAITTSIIDLCDELQIEVLAEGVEFAEDYDYLLGTSCGFAQGFFISHPIPQATLLQWANLEDPYRSARQAG